MKKETIKGIIDKFIKNDRAKRGLYIMGGKCIEAFLKKRDKQKFSKDARKYQKMNQYPSFKINRRYLYPIISEYRGSAGSTGDYFWQDLWGAVRIAKEKPELHYDIGSRVDGFIAHMIALKIPVRLIDIRPLDEKLPGVSFCQADATNLEGIPDDSVESISALCSLEHFGLGRYGDPIDPEACFKAFHAVQRVVKPGGRIYISLPVGKERCCFNAHRVFDPRTVKKNFSQCKLEEFSIVIGGAMEEYVSVAEFVNRCRQDVSVPGRSGEATGLFIFRKKDMDFE